MNKKQKLVARKHRKNKERIKSLKQASAPIASKNSKELVTKMEEKVQKVSAKKTTAKNPAVKKKTTAKKSSKADK